MDFEQCITFGQNDVLDTEVYFRPCENKSCLKKRYNDGLEDKILFLGTYAFIHAVLLDYYRYFLTGGCTMHHYYQNYVHGHVAAGNCEISKYLPYGIFLRQ